MALNVSYVELEPTWGWIVCTNSFYRDFNQEANKIVTVLVITLGLSLVIGGASIILFTRRLSNPLIKLANQVEQIAKGKLSIDVLKVKNKDEIGLLVQGFQQMTQIRQLITQISVTSVKEMGQLARNSTAHSRNVAASSEEQLASIEEITASAASLSHVAEEMQALVSQFSV